MGTLTAAALLDLIEATGGRIGLRADRLVIDSPAGAFDLNFRTAVQQQRPAIIGLVRSVTATTASDLDGIRWATPADFSR